MCSLGGLGRDQTQACVSNVSVHDVTIKNSQNGLRIKTWQVNCKIALPLMSQHTSIFYHKQ